MNKEAEPLKYIIYCCEKGIVPSHFDILNARNELQKLKEIRDKWEKHISHAE